MRIERIRDGLLVLTVAVFSVGLAAAGMILLLIVLVAEQRTRAERWVPTRLDLPLAVLAIVVVGSAAFSEWRSAIVGTVAYFFFTVLLSVRPAALFASGGAERTQRLLTVWVAGAIPAALWGIARPAPPGYAGASTAFIPQNTLGTTLAVALILGLGLLMTAVPRNRWLWAAGLVMIVAGLIDTTARAAWIGAAAGVVTLALVGAPARARHVLAVACVALIVIGAVVVPRWPALSAEIRSIASLEANLSRIVMWKAVPKIVADYPLLGTGFGTFAHVYPRYRAPEALEPHPPFAHNIFLNFAVETGLLGLAAFVALCASGLVATWRWLLCSPPGSPGRAAATAVLAALVTILVNQLFDGTALTVHGGFGLLALFALGAAGERYLPRPPETTPQ